eukprot:712353-Hanusia_phi.AAC.1
MFSPPAALQLIFLVRVLISPLLPVVSPVYLLSLKNPPPLLSPPPSADLLADGHGSSRSWRASSAQRRGEETLLCYPSPHPLTPSPVLPSRFSAPLPPPLLSSFLQMDPSMAFGNRSLRRKAAK